MAETVHLYLKRFNGTTNNWATIQGESQQTSLGRANSIECLHYEQEVEKITSNSSRSLPRIHTQYQPLLIRKRVDKSSPQLLQALTELETVEATFKFFRPNPIGDGTTEQFYTVSIKQARITSVKQYLSEPSSLTGALLLEEVRFTFQAISWTYTSGGIMHQDEIG